MILSTEFTKIGSSFAELLKIEVEAFFETQCINTQMFSPLPDGFTSQVCCCLLLSDTYTFSVIRRAIKTLFTKYFLLYIAQTRM